LFLTLAVYGCKGSATLFPKKDPLVSIEYEAVWVPEEVWTFWRRETSLAVVGNKPQFLVCPVHCPVLHQQN